MSALCCVIRIRIVCILTFFFDHFQVIDDTNVRRQIVQTTFRKEMRAMVCVVCFPLRLSDSWERIDFNLAELTKELFRTKYVETAKIQVSVAEMFQTSVGYPHKLNLLSSFAFSSRFMQIVGSEEYISRTDSIVTKSCRKTLNWAFLKKTNQHPARIPLSPLWSYHRCLLGRSIKATERDRVTVEQNLAARVTVERNLAARVTVEQDLAAWVTVEQDLAA